MDEQAPVKYVPIFVGKTEADEKIVLYKNVDKPNELHMKHDDGELWAIGPGSFIFTQRDFSEITRLEMSSTSWTGKATGTKSELIAEPSLHI